MVKVAVIGDADSVMGFRGLGLHVIATDSVTEASDALDELAKEDYGVVFMTEELAKREPDLIDRFREELIPAIILIPSSRGGEGYAMERLRDQVKRAVGMDLLSGTDTISEE